MSNHANYKLIIFDADGTLRQCTVKGQPCPNAIGQWELMAGVKEKITTFDFDKVMIGIASNQGGIALGYLDESTAYRLLWDLYTEMTAGLLPREGLIQLCPHIPDGRCDCRKPKPRMLLEIMDTAGDLIGREIKPMEVLFVGDRPEDQQAARNARVDFQWADEFFGRKD